jgi:hypothetical protein
MVRQLTGQVGRWMGGSCHDFPALIIKEKSKTKKNGAFCGAVHFPYGYSHWFMPRVMRPSLLHLGLNLVVLAHSLALVYPHPGWVLATS